MSEREWKFVDCDEKRCPVIGSAEWHVRTALIQTDDDDWSLLWVSTDCVLSTLRTKLDVLDFLEVSVSAREAIRLVIEKAISNCSRILADCEESGSAKSRKHSSQQSYRSQ